MTGTGASSLLPDTSASIKILERKKKYLEKKTPLVAWIQKNSPRNLFSFERHGILVHSN